jgi:hypothetical protein
MRKCISGFNAAGDDDVDPPFKYSNRNGYRQYSPLITQIKIPVSSWDESCVAAP